MVFCRRKEWQTRTRRPGLHFKKSHFRFTCSVVVNCTVSEARLLNLKVTTSYLYDLGQVAESFYKMDMVMITN